MVIILRKFLKFIGLLFLLIILYIWLDYLNPIERIKINNALYEDVKLLKIDGYSFRDLNKNNILDVYEDHRLNSKIRTEDLLNKMPLEEKVGQMFHPPFTLNPDIWMLIYEIAIRGNQLTESQILFDNISHFNLYGNPSPETLAKEINNFQKVASRTRLGFL